MTSVVNSIHDSACSFYESACNKAREVDTYMSERLGDKTWELAKKVALAAVLGFAFYASPVFSLLSVGALVGVRLYKLIKDGQTPLDKYNFSPVYGGFAIRSALQALAIATINPPAAIVSGLFSCLWTIIAIKADRAHQANQV